MYVYTHVMYTMYNINNIKIIQKIYIITGLCSWQCTKTKISFQFFSKHLWLKMSKQKKRSYYLYIELQISIYTIVSYFLRKRLYRCFTGVFYNVFAGFFFFRRRIYLTWLSWHCWKNSIKKIEKIHFLSSFSFTWILQQCHEPKE